MGIDLGLTSGPAVTADVAQGRTLSVDLYPDLAQGEVASVFQSSFDILMSGLWTWSLDLTRVDPGVAPFGVGTWPGGVGNQTPGRANISLTSDNTAGERLVAQLNVTRDSSDGGDFFRVVLADGTIVARDIPLDPFTISVPLTTDPGTTLVELVPEPTTGLLLGIGLAGLARCGSRRRLAPQD